MADVDPKSAPTRIELADEAEFELGGARVKPADRAVVVNGERRDLQPRVMQVLVALAKARPDVVSRDKLVEQCWDGRIVGDDALNRCILALRHLAQEFAPAPFAIETVPRVGHRLVVPSEPKSVAAAYVGRLPRWALISLIAVVLAAAGLFIWQQSRTDPGPASIAVLPFRNLGTGDPYFAAGIGEEILGQLAREPQFRVAGSSSSSQFGADPEVNEVARRLNVDYVLEGSVRRQGDRVRVDAGLVRASDGMRLWTDSYDGKLDDIFAIQQRIGSAVASALRRKLLQSPALSGPLVTGGEPYNLYLTARGLLRTRNRRVSATASNLLRDAISIDPGYAPAWASLAQAIYLEDHPNRSEGLIESLPRAIAYARHALKLAPDLGDAHGVLGMMLSYGSPEAQYHLRRAAQLDPNDAEAMLGLGVAFGAEGEFDRELAAYRRAGELDPLWFRTTGQQAIMLSRMGRRAEAEKVATRGFASNQANRHLLLGRIAWIFGDFSEAARHWSILARSNSPRWELRAKEDLAEAMAAVGLGALPSQRMPTRTDQRRRGGSLIQFAPDPGTWRFRNRNPIAADVYRDENHVAAKLMLGAGRADELIATFQGPVGLLTIRPRQKLRVDQLHEVAVVALALRQAGRSEEADALLRQADATVRAVYGRTQVPFWFDADAATIWAVRGQNEEALSALERAMRRGWTHTERTDLSDINKEPAFASLRGHPRFERIRSRLAAHLARERAEVERLGLKAVKPPKSPPSTPVRSGAAGR